eukprot:71853_1
MPRRGGGGGRRSRSRSRSPPRRKPTPRRAAAKPPVRQRMAAKPKPAAKPAAKGADTQTKAVANSTAAKPPATGGLGGGGLMNTMAQGAAFGVGSAMAHKAIDSVTGAFSGGDSGDDAAEYYDDAGTGAGTFESTAPCGLYQSRFTQCLQSNPNDASVCNQMYSMLTQCQQFGAPEELEM